MSEGQRRRIRRRRRVARGFKKTFINVVFAPTRIPKIKQDSVDLLMRLCEIAALAFVTFLVFHMALPELIRTGVVVFTGILFAIFLSLIKLADYQEKIEQYKYYGFRI
jgi:hypothetical protein